MTTPEPTECAGTPAHRHLTAVPDTPRPATPPVQPAPRPAARSTRPDLVPLALAGMPGVALLFACLGSVIGMWGLIPAGVALGLLVVLAAWSTGGGR